MQFLRRQIGIERQHGREVAALCGAIPARHESLVGTDFGHSKLDISNNYVQYMKYYLDLESARARAHIARMSSATDPTLAETTALESLKGALSEASLLELIEAAERVEALAERRYSIEDWRRVARVDADAVLEERRLWARLKHRVHRDGSVTRER